ncbi:peptidase S8/S53 domain-containing protein [Suillus placidus]|uniref:tripeptidyl-peptidase II n=1 Tax=Suillus placidus TaxID=48579 RepID=A0A9P6ZYD4_9AGAM|nr:peptidase S8/S53 domain-containing protein [Suillus placidus]
MKLITLLLFPFAAALASTVPFKGCHQKMKESIHGPPSGWYKHAPAQKHHMLELKIALPQPKFPELEQHLWEISDPSHARYGAYLSKQETEALMAPHSETLDVVSEWLALHGLTEEDVIRSSARDWVTIRVPVGLAEEMLDTTYHVYKHAETGESIVRTTSYSLPDILHHHVDFIQPTTMFARFKAFKSTLHWTNQAQPAVSSPAGGTITGPAGNSVDASCNHTITLSCLRQLYNAEDYETTATNCNKLGITGYLDQYANNKDLQQFYQAQNPSAYGSNYTLVSINGGKNNQSYAVAGGEANLDTQFGFGLVWPTPGTFYTTGGEPPFTPDLVTPINFNEPYTYWLEHVLSQDDIPQTISTSYGDDEQTVSYTYAIRVCAGMAALGARGVSLLFASGDHGVGGNYSEPATCKSNDGHNVTTFIPSFPASCPYVTAVGGTVSIPETAAVFSGGGFSNYFARPVYQEAAVSAYLAMLTPGTFEGLYNPTGRAFPDVAAQSEYFSMIRQGQEGPAYGTSCAAPVFAAFVSMLNDARINARKTPLGFLNPLLYSTGYNALNDITDGNNPGCGTLGFNATVGWDPVTGYGTPNFEKLKDLVLAMP